MIYLGFFLNIERNNKEKPALIQVLRRFYFFAFVCRVY